jgi:RecB family exonuclease
MLKGSSGVQSSLRIEESRSMPELAKALCRAGAVKGLDRVLDREQEGASGIRSALAERAAGPAPSAPLPAKSGFWVTELDQYLRCPYDYYVANILGLKPLEEVSEDISPLDRGSKVHAVLREFYRSWDGPVTGENRSRAQALLRELADRVFDREADTFRNRREKDLFLAVMAERFLDAEIGFWKQGMRPVLLERKIEAFKLTLPDGTTAEVHGKIDRIDMDGNGGFIIVDYKTGGYPQPRTGTEQEIFQLPLYAVMAQQAFSGAGDGERAVPLRKPIGLAYYDLTGRTGPHARDVVLFDRETREDHPAAKPMASPKSAADFELILRQSMDKARRAIEGIRAGRFAAAPQDKNRCRYCPNAVMCAKDER